MLYLVNLEGQMMEKFQPFPTEVVDAAPAGPFPPAEVVLEVEAAAGLMPASGKALLDDKKSSRKDERDMMFLGEDVAATLEET